MASKLHPGCRGGGGGGGGGELQDAGDGSDQGSDPQDCREEWSVLGSSLCCGGGRVQGAQWGDTGHRLQIAGCGLGIGSDELGASVRDSRESRRSGAQLYRVSCTLHAPLQPARGCVPIE